jgi:hypothetical protein
MSASCAPAGWNDRLRSPTTHTAASSLTIPPRPERPTRAWLGGAAGTARGWTLPFIRPPWFHCVGISPHPPPHPAITRTCTQNYVTREKQEHLATHVPRRLGQPWPLGFSFDQRARVRDACALRVCVCVCVCATALAPQCATLVRGCGPVACRLRLLVQVPARPLSFVCETV